MFSGTMLIDTTYLKNVYLFDSANFYNQNNFYFESLKSNITISDPNEYHNKYVNVLETT